MARTIENRVLGIAVSPAVTCIINTLYHNNRHELACQAPLPSPPCLARPLCHHRNGRREAAMIGPRPSLHVLQVLSRLSSVLLPGRVLVFCALRLALSVFFLTFFILSVFPFLSSLSFFSLSSNPLRTRVLIVLIHSILSFAPSHLFQSARISASLLVHSRVQTSDFSPFALSTYPFQKKRKKKRLYTLVRGRVSSQSQYDHDEHTVQTGPLQNADPSKVHQWAQAAAPADSFDRSLLTQDPPTQGHPPFPGTFHDPQVDYRDPAYYQDLASDNQGHQSIELFQRQWQW